MSLELNLILAGKYYTRNTNVARLQSRDDDERFVKRVRSGRMICQEFYFRLGLFKLLTSRGIIANPIKLN